MNPTTRYKNLSVRLKLRLMIMASVTAALLCACAAVLLYDRYATRELMRNDLEVMAEMVGANSTAALSFEDAKDGAEILSSLRVKHQIVAARILTAGGRSLASYRRAGAPPSTMPATTSDGVWFQPGRLVAFRNISLSGAGIGTIYLESDLEQLDTTMRRLGWIVVFYPAGRLDAGACAGGAPRESDSRPDRPSGACRQNRLQRKKVFDTRGQGFRRRFGAAKGLLNNNLYKS
jgi:hypothetical protein